MFGLSRLSLVGLRQRNGAYETPQFVNIQLPIMIPISTSELHFEISKYLVLRDRVLYGNGSYIVFDRHYEILRHYNALIGKRGSTRGALLLEFSIAGS